MPDGSLIKPGLRDVERLQGFEADWTKPAETVAKATARWGLVGSAVSVPVAEWIGRRLNEAGVYNSSRDVEFPVVGKAPRAARFDGQRRFAVRIGTDPLGIRPPSLADFLFDREGQMDLSLKATLGFLSRTRRAKLRFVPGFIEAVELHARRMADATHSGLPRQMSLLAA
jgi:DNA (cytosine-5)-methyltransferase 1